MTSTSTSAGTRRVHVVVVGGGANSEHAVGLASAAGVADALDLARFRVSRLTIERDGTWSSPDTGTALSFAAVAAAVAQADVLFPAVHGPGGEDGTLAALGALAGVRVVGSGVAAGAIAMDKWVTKLVAVASGVSVAPGVLLERAATLPVPEVDPNAVGPLPWIVKPVTGGSSFGVSRVDTLADLDAALAEAFAHDDRVLVERLVVGREIDIAVLSTGRPDGEPDPASAPHGRIVGPPLEVLNDPAGFFDASTKYDGTARFALPASLDPDVAARLRTAAVTMADRLGCRGVVRVDCFVTPDGEVVLNEVNTMPGLTEHSQVPAMFANIGIEYPDLLAMLVEGATR